MTVVLWFFCKDLPIKTGDPYDSWRESANFAQAKASVLHRSGQIRQVSYSGIEDATEGYADLGARGYLPVLGYFCANSKALLLVNYLTLIVTERTTAPGALSFWLVPDFESYAN
jgi:hypothetical protein